MGLSAAFNAVGISASVAKLAITGVTAVISLGVIAWQEYQNSQEEARQKALELSEAFKTQTESLKSDISTIESLKDEFTRLSKGVTDYGRNISLSTEEYKRYQDIVSQILGISPQLVSGYDEEGNAIADKNNLIERSIELLKEEQRLRLQENTSLTQVQKLGEAYAKELENFEANKLNADGTYIADGLVNQFGQDIKRAIENSSEFKAYDIFSALEEKLGLDSDSFWEESVWNQYNGDVYSLVSNHYDAIMQMVLDRDTELTQFFDSDQLSAFDLLINNHRKNVADYEAEVSRMGTALNPTLQLLPQTLTSYNQLSDAQKVFLSEYINGFKITANTTADDLQKMRQDILSFTDDVANNESAQNIIDKLFSVNQSSLSADEYVSQIRDLIGQIADELNLEEETAIDLKAVLGIADDGAIITALDSIKEQYGDTVEAITLNTEDLAIAYGILQEEGSLTWETLLEMIEEYKHANDGIPQLDLPDVSDNLAEFSENINQLYSQFDMLNAAMDEWNEMGAISAKTFQSLTENNLLQYLEWTADGLAVNCQAMLDREQQLKNNAKAELQTALANDLLAVANDNLTDSEFQAQYAAKLVGQAMFEAGQNANNATPGILNYAEAMTLAHKAAAGENVEIPKVLSERTVRQQQTLIDSYNTMATAIDNITFSTNSASNAFGGYTGNTKSAAVANKALNEELKRQKEILKEQEDSINALLDLVVKMIKQEQKLVKDALKDELDARKKILDAAKQTLQAEIDSYKKRIDAQKESLRLQEKERDYQKELQKKQKAVSDIEAQLIALRYDDSEAAQKKKLELEEQLSNFQEDLAEYQHDRGIELQEDALDKEYNRFKEVHDKKIEALEAEYNAFKEQQEQRIKDIEDYLSKEGQIRQDAIALIDEQSTDLYRRLIEWNRLYGDGVNDTITTAWFNAYNALEKFNGGQINVLNTLKQIAVEMSNLEAKANAAADAVNRANGSSTNNPAQSSSNSQSKYRLVNKLTGGIQKDGFLSEDEAEKYRQGLAVHLKSNFRIEKYAKGSKYIPYNQLAQVDEQGREIIVSPQHGRLVSLKTGDGVIPHNQTEMLLNLANNPNQILSDAMKSAFMNPSIQAAIVNKNTPPIEIDARLIVQGSIEENMLSKVQQLLKQQQSEIFKSLDSIVKH